jgi:ethanolamine transporter
MNTTIMWIMAAGAAAGGLDRICGNRLGLGKRFEEGFMLLGATALSMAGIICLTPLLSGLLKQFLVPLWNLSGLDPGILGGILAIDMGGYQLSMELANAPSVGRYAGIVAGATFGCTVTFTIPVGMGMISRQERPLFARGILIGLGMMPVSLVMGGLFCGLGIVEILLQSLPVFLLSLMFMSGIRFFPDQTIKGFGYFAAGIGFLTTVGLTAGAVEYMTGFRLLKGLAPIEEAMAVVSSIGVVMLGSLPVAEILRRLLEKPLNWACQKTGMNGNSVAGLLMGIVSPVPAIAMMKEMDARGKVVNAAFLVCGASALAAHMGFTFGTEPDLVLPLLLSKLAGGLCGAAAALLLTGQADGSNISFQKGECDNDNYPKITGA